MFVAKKNRALSYCDNTEEVYYTPRSVYILRRLIAQNSRNVSLSNQTRIAVIEVNSCLRMAKSLSLSPRTNRLSYRLTRHPHTHTQSKKRLNCYVHSSLSNVCNSFYSGYVHPFGSHYILVVCVVFPRAVEFQLHN